MKRSTRITIVVASAILAVGIVLFFPAIPQAPEYHDFVDQRQGMGIPNVLDVLSNLPFVLVGGWALWTLLGPANKIRPAFVEPREKGPWVVLFIGTLLTGFGSAFYHWAPSNESLVWDRLPMAIVAMSLLSAVIAERVGVQAGLRALPPLLIAGIGSVVYWIWSEQRDAGDLRFYGVVQFLPMLLIPLLILLFAPRYTGAGGYFGALGWYILAKMAEALDETIYAAGQLFSGHTLKHLLAALALFWLYRMIARREPVPHLRPASNGPRSSISHKKNDRPKPGRRA